jgi:prolipoprotein diacylglyceryltransferase
MSTVPTLSTTFPAFLTMGVAAAFAWLLLVGDEPSMPAVHSTSRVTLIDGALAGLTAGLLSARLAYVMLHWPAFAVDLPAILALWQGGLVGWAGLIGAPIGLALYCRAARAPFWRMADALALPAGLILFSSWLGCLQDGCAYGRAADEAVWAVNAPDWTGMVRRRWPTQTIGAVSAVAAIGWAYVSQRRWTTPSGTGASVSFLLLAAGGLWASFFRADPAATIVGLRHDLFGYGLLLIGGIGLSLWRIRMTEEAD